METQANLQHTYPVLLDEEAHILWNKIKTKENVSTDMDVASILIKQYGEVQSSQSKQPVATCSKCATPIPLLCSNCQPQKDIDFSSSSVCINPLVHAATGGCMHKMVNENQPPTVYRLLHISAKGESNKEETNFSAAASTLTADEERGETYLDGNAVRTCDPIISAHAKDLCSAGNSIIIVDYFNKEKDDVPAMCPEEYIFTSIRQTEDFGGDSNLRISVNVPTQEDKLSKATSTGVTDNMETTVITAEFLTSNDVVIVPGSNIQSNADEHHINQVGSVVTLYTGGENWFEQLLNGDASTQMLEKCTDTDIATAAVTLEALSADVSHASVQVLWTGACDTPAVKVKPRRGKPVPPGRIRICRICGRQCTSPALLKRHVMLHTGEKPYVCDQCGVAYNQSGNLRKHKIESHTPNDNIQSCPKCGVRFALTEDLHHHMRFHDSDRQHTCNACNKAFASTRSLRIHKKTHAGDRPWKCVDCGATFPSKRKLAVHRSSHTGEKALVCKYCDAVYASPEELRLHRKEMHKGACKGEKAARRARLHAKQ